MALAPASGQRTDDEMRAIAAAKLGLQNNVKAADGHQTGDRIRCTLSRPALNVYSPTDAQGFVIVAKDEHVPAILAYGDGSFPTEQIPADIQWWMESVERNLSGQTPSMGRVLLSEYKPINNFITTQWDQGKPYNLKTPKVNGQNTPVGCVAVALAQCMNYWKYPESANFTETYYVKDDKATSMEGTVSSAYTWDYSDTYSYNSMQGKKIAQLMSDCGIATGMQYATAGSGTFNFMAGRALTKYFTYPMEAVKYTERTFCTDEEWYSIIYDELMKKAPIIFGGQDAKYGGHAFVLSGIDKDGLVYVNWGWNGYANGFFAIDLMNSPEGSFSEGQDIVYGIRTTALPTDVVQPRVCSNDYQPYTFSLKNEIDDNGKSRKAIHIRSTSGFWNMTPTKFDGEFGIFGTDLTTGEAWEITETDPFDWDSGVGYFLDAPEDLFYYYVDDEMMKGHTYRLSFGTRDKREGTWHSVLADGGEVAYDVYYTGNPFTTTISERVTPTAIQNVQATHTKATNLTRVYDLQGRLIHTSPTAQFNLWEVPARGTLIVKQGEKVRKVVK